MASFVVLQRDGRPGVKATENIVFVRDAFSIIALAVPVLWLMWHRLWFAALIVLFIMLALSGFLQYSRFAPMILPLNLLMGMLVAIEGPAWRITALKSMGYAERGTVEAETCEEAQIRWSFEHTGNESRTERPVAVRNYAPTSTQADDLIFGISDNGRS